jgi:choice-of-anchor B domain-containing protein
MARYVLVLTAVFVTAWAPLAQEVTSAPAAACVAGSAGGFACNAVDLLANLTPQQLGAPPLGSCGAYPSLCTNEVSGWVDPTDGTEYAIIGLANGVAFVDVSNPEVPVFLGRLPQPAGVSISTWHTLKVYQDHVFIGSEAAGHGVQVFDLTRLRDVTSPPVVLTQDGRYTGNSNAHTLDINEESGFLYVAGGTQSNTANCDGGGLHIVDIRTPTAPTYAGCFDADGYTHEAQCITYDGPDATYVGRQICAAYNQDHVAFVDVTNPAAPTLISTGQYPGTGYTHQGWFTEDRRYILIDDEFDIASGGTRTIVMNVEDLDDPTYDFDYRGPLATYAHNLYIRGHYAFLSNYTGGLHIVDLQSIDSNVLTEVAYFDTYQQGNPLSYAGQWANYPYLPSGNVLASDGRYGLFVLRPTGIVTAGENGPLPAAGFSITPARPNPTTGRAQMDLRVAESQRVRVEAFDVLGRSAAIVFDGEVAAGAAQTLVFDAAGLAVGPYILRVAGETFSTTARVSVAR